MNKVDKILSEKEIVREQFWALPVLQQKIHIINDVNDYHETKNIIGNKADKIRFHSYMEAFDKMMYNCQYTILLEDDSMVFLFYEFNDNNFFSFYPFTFFGNRSRSVVRTFLHNTHVFHFV